jgi:hypothetical protein
MEKAGITASLLNFLARLDYATFSYSTSRVITLKPNGEVKE